MQSNCEENKLSTGTKYQECVFERISSSYFKTLLVLIFENCRRKTTSRKAECEACQIVDINTHTHKHKLYFDIFTVVFSTHFLQTI